MHKRLFFAASLIFAVISTSSLYASYVTSSIGVYKFASKVIKCEISYDNRSTWRTIWDYTGNEGSAPTVDLGSGSVGAQMGTFMSGISAPIGTVTDMRVTVTTSLVMRGWVKSGATYYFTDPSVALQTNSQAGVPTDGQCLEITMSPPAGSGIPSSMTNTVTITGGGLSISEGQTRSLSIIFPMDNLLSVQAISGVGTIIMPAEVTPTVSPQS